MREKYMLMRLYSVFHFQVAVLTLELNPDLIQSTWVLNVSYFFDCVPFFVTQCTQLILASPSEHVLSPTHQFSVSNLRLGCLQFLFQKFYVSIKLRWFPNNLRCNKSKIDIDDTYYTLSYTGTRDLFSIRFMLIII